ncbi:phosphatase PAP2 family protein [Marinilabilia salmonicolor]|uniref:phosphatase PAP2 family protein n=2 Tax=Marinilabilia salmonicolor TaxID=989 RepID=UPI000299F620|nr:phosphatase PAP2 family protein [Marinilabilia salmonicolor]
METLIQLDQELLLYFNSFTSPLFDNIFWLITSKSIWVPMYVMILYAIFKNQGIKGFMTVVFLGLMVLLCDQISTNIFKEGFERFRPSHEPALEGMVDLINGKRGGQFGFVSSHATNSFGLAVFSLLLFRFNWYTVFILFWAALNSYSRIYMGVHYPGDILGGLILGSLIGWVVYWLYRKVASRFLLIPDRITPTIGRREFALPSVRLVIFTGLITFILIFLSGKIILPLTV